MYNRMKVLIRKSDTAAYCATCGLIAAMLYMLPSVIAWGAPHRRARTIFWVNLLTGWTVLGWVAAWFWANRSAEAQA